MKEKADQEVPEYLPFRLYNELLLNPSPKTVIQCAEHLTALLQTVQTYCSSPILTEAQPCPRNVQGRWCEATLLFADISGFTAMSERLNARGRPGAEEITGIVNEYFTTMVDILHQNGSFLIKFGGDSLLGMFVGQLQDTARYAVQAALDMKQAMVQFADMDTSVGRFELQMKVGIHTGHVFAAHVGTARRMEYWVTGDGVNHTALAEKAAEKGQIVVSEATRQHLRGWIQTEPLPNQPAFYELPVSPQVRRLELWPVCRDLTAPQAISELTHRLDTLVPYLPAGLLPRLVYNPRSRRVEGEHRLVAVLFVNVVGFSELATALAPAQADALTETMQDYFATMQSIVEGHGGTINKTDLYTAGDKLLVVFGAPVAHEDDVDQAARTAIAMQAAMEEVNQRLAARFPNVNVRLRQRIGLSTGYVFSGNVGAKTYQEYTIMGDEVNLAAGLMSATPWNEIWVSSHVFYWLEPFGTFEHGGAVSLKGRRKPVQVYQLEHIGKSHRPRPPFVDRVQAMATLRGCLDRLLQGQGHIISLTGEPGIGKSRLLAELRPVAEAQDVLWLTGSCREQQATYHLLASLLRDYLKLDTADDPNIQRQILVQRIEDLFGPHRIKEKGPFLAIVMDLPLVKEWGERVEFLGERLSARLAQETAEFFGRLAQDQPAVLVCDDLHWLDPGSADILLKLIELVEYAPVVLGFTLRPGQYPAYGRVSGAAMTQFFDWHTQIRLEPLGADDSAQVLAAILGQAASSEFQERVYQRSRGNPLFIAEIARTAVVAPDVSIPDRVQKIIESRVDALPEGPRRTLKASAVIGAEFTLPELMYVLEEHEPDIRRNLAALRRMQLIDIKEKKYEFVHLLAWEVIYGGLSDQVRGTFHRQLGVYWAGQANPQKAAYHYFAAQVWDQALEQSERAADQRRKAYANKEAIRLYRQALTAGGELEDLAAQSRLYHRLGQVHRQAGNYEQAVQAHEKELGLLLSQTDELAQAKAYSALGRIYDEWGKYDQALDALERGLKRTGLGRGITRAQLLRVRCSVLRSTGKLDEAERDGLEALRIAQSLEARREEAYACNNLGVVYGIRGKYELALKYHQRSLAIRRELDVAYEIAQSLGNVGTAFSYLGQLDEAEPCYQEALAIQNQLGDRFGEGHIHHNLAWLHRDRGETEAAESEFLRAMTLWEQIDHWRGIAFVHNDLGTLYQDQERWEKARDHLEGSARLYEAMGANTFLPENYVALAQVYLGLCLLEDALTAAQKAFDWARRNKDRRQETIAYRALSEVHLAGANLSRAEHYAQRCLDLARAEPALPDQVQAATELLEKIRQP